MASIASDAPAATSARLRERQIARRITDRVGVPANFDADAVGNRFIAAADRRISSVLSVGMLELPVAKVIIARFIRLDDSRYAQLWADRLNR